MSALCGNDNKVKSKLLRPFSDVDALAQIFVSASSKFIIFIWLVIINKQARNMQEKN